MASPKATPGATGPASEQPGLELTGRASGEISPSATIPTINTAPAGGPTASQEVDLQAVRRELISSGIYTSSDQLVSDLQQRAQAVSMGDTEKLAFLDKRLSAAGIIVPPFSAGLAPRFNPVMPVMQPTSDSPINITGLPSAPTIGAASEQFYDAAQGKSPPGSPKGSEDGQWELEPDVDGTYNSLKEARERLLTEDKLISGCPPFDLDDLAQLQHAFEECNQRCIRAELNPDHYTGAILSTLVQLSVTRFQEKTRLQAVHHQVAGLRRAQTSVAFSTLRSICEAVDASAEPQVLTPGKSFLASMDEVNVAAFQEGYKLDADAQDLVTKGDLTAAQGLLWHGDALMVPKYDLLRQDVMYNLHDASISGHPGVRRTKKLVRRCFWWPGMDTDIGAYVQTCATCQRNKARTHSATVPLLPLEVPSRPWQSVSMDFITSLPKTKAGKTAILVFVCRLTKMVHMCATVNECTSADCAFLFLNTVFKLHGSPLELVSDRDARFTSAAWTEMCELLQIKGSMSTAYHPQTGGQTKRMNRVLEDMLRHYVSPTQQDWDVHLPLVEFAINNAYQESTQTTPFMLHYGLHPHTPASIARRQV